MTRRPALRLALPGEWSSFGLSPDDDVLSAEVAEFIRSRLGRRDDHATVRAQQRANLGAAVRRARDAGATQFHLSLDAPGGLAFASTVAEYRPALPLGDSIEPASLADALVGVLAPEIADAEPDQRWDAFAAAGGVVFERPEGLVLRRERRIEPGDPARETPAVAADYWLTEPGRNRVVLLTFTTALAELAPLMTELFDAIVGAAAWIESDSAAALRAELHAGD